MISGLNDQEVADSRREHGWNLLTPPKKQSLWTLYLEKYKDPIIQILLVAALASSVLAVIEHEYIETVGIFIAILLSTTVGFLFEMDAARKFDVLTQLNEEQQVKVVRNGQVCLVARKEIVVGDTVLIETGDEIPADGVLDDSNSLQVDESMLTGEPITTKSATVRDGDGHGETAYASNYVMRSTMVMNGRGRFVVTAVGDAINTAFGVSGTGFLGLGAGQGWLKYVAAADTDLVFAFVCEEWGLILGLTMAAAIVILGIFVMRSAAVGRSSFYTIGACAAIAILMILRKKK